MTDATSTARKRREIYRELEHLAWELNHAVDAVIVEGPHDAQTLHRLGYQGPILQCAHQNSTALRDHIVERFHAIVLFTDFDAEGERIHHRLRGPLQTRGVIVNTWYRRRLHRILRTVQITTIEGIYALKIQLFP